MHKIHFITIVTIVTKTNIGNATQQQPMEAINDNHDTNPEGQSRQSATLTETNDEAKQEMSD